MAHTTASWPEKALVRELREEKSALRTWISAGKMEVEVGVEAEVDVEESRVMAVMVKPADRRDWVRWVPRLPEAWGCVSYSVVLS